MLVLCPHCGQMIEIVEENCKIFRCGVYKNNYKQIDPHAPKIICDNLVRDNLIFGCGRPFMLVDKKAILCSYI